MCIDDGFLAVSKLGVIRNLDVDRGRCIFSIWKTTFRDSEGNRIGN